MTIKSPVLVLNSSYEPISICAARRALKLYVKGVAAILETYDALVWKDLKLPCVIRLQEFRRIPHKRQMVRVQRRNIFLRDGHMCQYCGSSLPGLRLTIDHVIPRSRGGKDVWENMVSSCSPCNKKKGNRTLEEAGMKLLLPPRALSIHTARHLLRAHGAENQKWHKYLYY